MARLAALLLAGHEVRSKCGKHRNNRELPDANELRCRASIAGSRKPSRRSRREGLGATLRAALSTIKASVITEARSEAHRLRQQTIPAQETATLIPLTADRALIQGSSY